MREKVHMRGVMLQWALLSDLDKGDMLAYFLKNKPACSQANNSGMADRIA